MAYGYVWTVNDCNVITMQSEFIWEACKESWIKFKANTNANRKKQKPNKKVVRFFFLKSRLTSGKKRRKKNVWTNCEIE